MILQMTFIWCDGMSESIFNTKKMKTSKAWLYIVFSLLVCVYFKKKKLQFSFILQLRVIVILFMPAMWRVIQYSRESL